MAEGSWDTLTAYNEASTGRLKNRRIKAMRAAAKRRQRDNLMVERDQVAQSMQAQRDSANRANMGRYAAQISSLNELGRGTRMQIRKSATQQMAQAAQSATSRGLGGATVMGSFAKRAGEAAGLGHAQLADRLAQARIAVHGNVSDIGPDMGPLAAASQQLGYGLTQRTQPAPYSRAGSRLAPMGDVMGAAGFGPGQFAPPAPAKPVVKPKKAAKGAAGPAGYFGRLWRNVKPV